MWTHIFLKAIKLVSLFPLLQFISLSLFYIGIIMVRENELIRTTYFVHINKVKQKIVVVKEEDFN